MEMEDHDLNAKFGDNATDFQDVLRDAASFVSTVSESPFLVSFAVLAAVCCILVAVTACVIAASCGSGNKKTKGVRRHRVSEDADDNPRKRRNGGWRYHQHQQRPYDVSCHQELPRGGPPSPRIYTLSSPKVQYATTTGARPGSRASTTALWNSRLGLNNQQPSSVYAESPRISADHAGATGGGAGGGGRMRRPYSVAAIEPVHLAEEFTGAKRREEYARHSTALADDSERDHRRRREETSFMNERHHSQFHGSDDDDVAVVNFDGGGNGGGSDVTEIIREEVFDDEGAALPDPPTAAPFHDEDDHYDNIQIRQASSMSSFGNWNNNTRQ